MSMKLKCTVMLFLAAGLIFGGPAAAKTYNIGVLISLARPAMTADQKGFAKALKEAGLEADYDRQDAQGDAAGAEAIAEKFVADKVDLVHAVGLVAAQAAAKIIKQVPVVYSSVRDPVGAGIVPSMAAAGGNITGVSNAWPIARQVEEFHQILPAAKTWGAIYSTTNPFTAPAIEKIRETMQQKGLELTAVLVKTYDEIGAAAESLVGKVDAFFIPADHMVAKEFGTIGSVCDKNKIPLFSGFPTQVTRGAAVTMGVDPFQVGYSAGHKAIQILKEGKQAGEIPSSGSEHLIIYVSLKNAKRQGLQIPEKFIKTADRVFK